MSDLIRRRWWKKEDKTDISAVHLFPAEGIWIWTALCGRTMPSSSRADRSEELTQEQADALDQCGSCRRAARKREVG